MPGSDANRGKYNLRIIVPIKQVPESGKVKMDPETGTILRSAVESVINPLDLYALETAIRLREQHGGTVTTITLGPLPAEKALRQAIAMGCDQAVLVSDRKFSGSDTWATSYTLAAAIRKMNDCDLIITGERATDGDTAQVGPGLAAWLDLPLATYVAGITEIKGRSMTVARLVEEGYQIVELPMPALITVVKEIAFPRLPTLRGKKKSKVVEISLFNSTNLDLDPCCIGLSGSPTKVVDIHSPKVTRGGTVVSARDDGSVVAAVDQLIRFMEEQKLI